MADAIGKATQKQPVETAQQEAAPFPAIPQLKFTAQRIAMIEKEQGFAMDAEPPAGKVKAHVIPMRWIGPPGSSQINSSSELLIDIAIQSSLSERFANCVNGGRRLFIYASSLEPLVVDDVLLSHKDTSIAKRLWLDNQPRLAPCKSFDKLQAYRGVLFMYETEYVSSMTGEVLPRYELTICFTPQPRELKTMARVDDSLNSTFMTCGAVDFLATSYPERGFVPKSVTVAREGAG
jgi:hypothetical protein